MDFLYYNSRERRENFVSEQFAWLSSQIALMTCLSLVFIFHLLAFNLPVLPEPELFVDRTHIHTLTVYQQCLPLQFEIANLLRFMVIWNLSFSLSPFFFSPTFLSLFSCTTQFRICFDLSRCKRCHTCTEKFFFFVPYLQYENLCLSSKWKRKSERRCSNEDGWRMEEKKAPNRIEIQLKILTIDRMNNR